MARATLTGVFAVVIEILRAQSPLFITDETVGLHQRGIEFDLYLGVLGDSNERAAHLFGKHLVRFVEAVDVGIVAITFIGKFLHGRILQVAHADAENGEEHVAFGLLLDEVNQLILVGNTDVKIAVGAQNNTIHAALDEVAGGFAVGGLNARAAIGRATGFEAVDDLKDRFLVVAAGGRQRDARIARVHNDSDTIPRCELLD